MQHEAYFVFQFFNNFFPWGTRQQMNISWNRIIFVHLQPSRCRNNYRLTFQTKKLNFSKLLIDNKIKTPVEWEDSFELETPNFSSNKKQNIDCMNVSKSIPMLILLSRYDGLFFQIFSVCFFHFLLSAQQLLCPKQRRARFNSGHHK